MKGICFIEDHFPMIISGIKTKTRRFALPATATAIEVLKCQPRYKRGEFIYLKEPCFVSKEIRTYKYLNEQAHIYPEKYWKNKLFMGLFDARYFIKVKDVRLERLRKITKDDAIAEGCQSVADYRRVWDKIAGVGEYDKNPWVFVYEFEFMKPGISFKIKDSQLSLVCVKDSVTA